MSLPLNLLALDLGAESGRAIVGSLDGGQLSLDEVHRFANVPVELPDGLHWDILRLWHDIQEGLALAVRKKEDIVSLGLDTWGVDFGLFDNQDALIANPFHYRDNRTDGMVEEGFRRMPRQQIFEHTGIQFMQLNTLFQLLSMVESGSPALSIAKTFLTMPDIFNFWLTGEKVCEFSIATTTQCYDPRRQNWSEPVLHAMGIPGHIFPDIVQPGTVLGKLHPLIAEKIGVDNLTIIAPACHDTGSAVAAVPADGDNFAWISSGTWSIMGINSPEPVISEKSLNYNFTNEGGVGQTFRFSKNIMGLWLIQECRRTWMAEGEEYSYATLTEMADKALNHISVIDPDHNSFLKPGDMPSRIREYCRLTGQRVPKSAGETVRVALEGLALKYRWVLERLEELTGQHFETIHIIGGGTQNQLLSQFTADATGRTVITGPIEATAIGNILTQAISLGELASIADARAVVRNSFEMITFNPQSSADWDQAYAKLLELLA